ncbi:MAG: phosphoribosyl-AMP cyclohydrolase [Verrucomicrobia bacterium]|nr:MAG: phosphoribosyl-AMP cyclohydrolase [Verrucomicrobiota bacterium]
MNFNFNFNADGLIPAIIQQNPTPENPCGRVLMMAWMNREAIEISLKTGMMHYWSRSRRRLWYKGEMSGHTQRIVRWFVDCDGDTLLFHVDQAGGACHTGFESCFFSELDRKGEPLPLQEKPLFNANEIYKRKGETEFTERPQEEKKN